MTQSDIIEKMFNFAPTNEAIEKLEAWHKFFVEYNSHTNLMSRNDVDVVFEKHVLDSLSISLLKEFKKGISLLDVGCGGGFPSLILAIFFNDIKIYALDSTSRKTKFISYVKEKLELSNLEVINARSEEISPLNVDILTNRAVGKIETVWGFSSLHLKSGGIFVSYKALTGHDEAGAAIKKYKNLANPVFVPYNLPLKENYTRELVVLTKV